MWFQIVIIFVVIFIWFKHRFAYWKRLGFPYSPGISNELGITMHTCEYTKQEYEKHKNKGPAFGIFLAFRPVLIPTDHDLIKEIFVKNFDNFHDHGWVINEKADPLAGHLFFKNGQEWKELREKLSPTFTSGRIKMMMPTIVKAANRMTDYLKVYTEKSESIEMKELFSSYTTEVIADTAFGLEVKCLGNYENEFIKAAKSLLSTSFIQYINCFMIMSFENLAYALKLRLNTSKTINFFTKIVRDTLNYRETNKIFRNDYFQLLMNIKKSEEGMPFNELAANCFIFLLAGFGTSSSAMTFFAYELALNPDIQEKLRDEINEVVAQHNDEVTYDGIMEMKYLDMVFNETLRKYPVIDIHFRKAVKDFKIPKTNLVIPENTLIMVPVYALHNDERFFPEPEKFDPERFTVENISKRHAFSYIPFSEGPRICIGSRFGSMQAKIGIINVLRNFRISTNSKTPITIKYDPYEAFMSPKNGMWLKLEKLESDFQ